MSATATPRRPAAGQSTPKRPTRAHGAMALVLIALGAYPFLTGAYAERSLLWNSASVVLLPPDSLPRTHGKTSWIVRK